MKGCIKCHKPLDSLGECSICDKKPMKTIEVKLSNREKKDLERLARLSDKTLEEYIVDAFTEYIEEVTLKFEGKYYCPRRHD